VEDTTDPANPIVIPGRFLAGVPPREVRSASWRTTAGIDWTPMKRTSIGLLAHHTTNDAPTATPVAHTSDDFTLRTKWRDDDGLSFTSVWRHVEGRNLAGYPYDPATALGANQRFRLDVQDRFLLAESRSDSVTM